MPAKQSSTRAGDIIQNGWVVPDLQLGMRQWLDMGYGPFLTFIVDLPDAIYRGRTVPLKSAVALTHGGGVQIELIQQLSSGPSAYRDVYAPNEGGFHHVCKIVDDYALEVAALRSRGIVFATEAAFHSVHFGYADTRATLGCILEVVPNVPLLHAMNQAVIDAARNWDGSDPIRPLKLPS
ncbi:MAG: VOC family protein [Steroidobacteraceae bacterium]